jgi:hypothetical protein
MFAAITDLGHPAFAYIDPGSGSVILQLLLGGSAGIVMVLKLYWERITNAISNARVAFVQMVGRKHVP